MITRTQQARATRASLLRNLAALAVMVLVAGGGFLGVRALVKNAEAAKLKAELVGYERRAESLKAEIARANAMVSSTAPSDLSAVTRFQAVFEQAAANNNCSLTEFRSAAEILPFLTRFAKTTSAKGWSQVGAQTTLVGKPSDVVAAIADLNKSDLPFEFDALEIAREKVGPTGEATVRANLNFRVLLREGKKA